jgi:hypothetical protein
MNLIGLTGSNMHAMAEVAEQLLAAVSTSGHAVVIALYVEDAGQVAALRAHNPGRVEIWHIGADHAQRFAVDAFIDDSSGAQAMASAVDRQLARYLHRITHGRAVPAAFLHQPEME